MAEEQTQIRLIEGALQQAALDIAGTHLRDLVFQPGRDALCFGLEDMQVDCTRQPITNDILAMLLELAEAKSLRQSIDDMFSAAPINLTENRPVLHHLMRTPQQQKTQAFQKLSNFAEKVRVEKVVKSVVNLGVGGSDLGPAMVTQALAGFHDGPAVHYVGNIDPCALFDILQICDPASTLFIVTSKTFTTVETLANAALARRWLDQNGINPCDAMVAVTAVPDRAVEWGIDDAHIFTLDDGVGGRYSLWSAVGLAAMIAIGKDDFLALLDGAHKMDIHFKTAPFDQNIPVIMGLLRVWHRSYLGRMAYGLMPYDQRLLRLPAWAQQLEMESNGKRVDRHGNLLSVPAGPLIWGEPGTNGQHSFFQWLHQSVDIVPIDILVALRPTNLPDDAAWQDSHKMLAVNAVAQAEALALGLRNTAQPHRHVPGNRPCVMISWDATTPYALGRLLALYEHITVTSGFLWNVNSFDQWGVELGKKMATEMTAKTDNGSDLTGYSPAARAFLDRLNYR